MPGTWTGSEIAAASGVVALSIASGWLGARGGQLVADLLPESDFNSRVVGGINACVQKTVWAPFVTIQRMLQYNDDDELGEPEPLDGGLDCAQRIYAREGWRGFFHGHLPDCFRYIPTQFLSLNLKAPVKTLFKALWKKLPDFPGKHFVNNVLTGTVHTAMVLTVVYPLDHTSLQLKICKDAKGMPLYSSMLDYLKREVQTLGDVPNKLYSGFLVTVGGVVLYRATYFLCHTLAADWGYKSGWGKFVAGNCTTLAAAYVTYPVRTMHLRLISDARRPLGERRYTGVLDCLTKICMTKGVSALFPGAGYNALRTVAPALPYLPHFVYDCFLKQKTTAEVPPKPDSPAPTPGPTPDTPRSKTLTMFSSRGVAAFTTMGAIVSMAIVAALVRGRN
eukprot:g5719.t1